MDNLDKTSQAAKELFNKIRGRFKNVTIGDANATPTNVPEDARFYEFEFKPGSTVSCQLTDTDVIVMFSDNLVSDDPVAKNDWYSFLQALRKFSRSRALQFDVRNLDKNSISTRDFMTLTKQVESIDLKKYIEKLN